jgi:hypothetical protein
MEEPMLKALTAAISALSIVLASTITPAAVQKVRERRVLSADERAEITALLNRLVESSNAGRWEDYAAMLFASKDETDIQNVVEYHRKYYPAGNDPKIAAIELRETSYDTTGTHPGDWALGFALTLEGETEGHKYSGTIYATKENGRWYCLPPIMDLTPESPLRHERTPWSSLIRVETTQPN